MARVDERTAREAAEVEIGKELQALRADMAALVQTVREYGVLAAADLRGRGEGAAADALAEAERAMRDVRGRVDAAQVRLEGDVRANPLAWLAGAVGLGLLVGLLFGRRG